MTARKVAPTHPGVVLAEALDSMGLKIMPAAKLLGTSRQTLHKILRGDGPGRPGMALKIGARGGSGPNLWINMQANHFHCRDESDNRSRNHRCTGR